MNIYCLTVTYNQSLSKKFDFLKDYDFNFIQIVFDNSTNSNTQQEIKEYCQKNNIIYETQNKNIGLSKAYNFVIKKYLADDDWIIIFDQDTEVTKEYFDKINDILKNPKSLSYFAYFKYGKNRYGPKVIKNYSKYKIANNHEFKHLNGYLIGINSCSLFSKKIFDKVGGFNERLFLYYIDNEFCFRLAKANISSETIDILVNQDFFSHEKSDYRQTKNRFKVLTKDGSVFFSSELFGSYVSKSAFLKEKIKVAMLYSIHNNIFWFLPMLFAKNK